ncbi:MAG: hypothetical protein DCC58_10895 [Chloroflexi bacterium]|nr:MAG: hypothetical protein DCC58_10895 [Chloroflexota bacterium]
MGNRVQLKTGSRPST